MPERKMSNSNLRKMLVRQAFYNLEHSHTNQKTKNRSCFVWILFIYGIWTRSISTERIYWTNRVSSWTFIII